MKRWIYRLLLGVLMFVTATHIYFSLLNVGVELFSNTGFETAGAGGVDVFASWDEYHGTSGGAVTDEGTLVHSGSHAARLEEVHPPVIPPPLYRGVGVAQSAVVVPGHDTEVSFWARGDGVRAGKYWIYDVTNAAFIVTHTDAIPGTSYIEIVEEFEVPAGCVSIEFYYYAELGGQVAYVDDVTFSDLGVYEWVECKDVLPSPPLVWEYGIMGSGPLDLLASTGSLTAYLDNSKSNEAGKDGYYSPEHTNALYDFGVGTRVKVRVERVS